MLVTDETGKPTEGKVLHLWLETSWFYSPEKELMVDRQESIAQEIENLEENYLLLITSVHSAMEDANPSLMKLKKFSQFYMKNKVATVEEMFDLLEPFYFLDYALLEKLVKFFLPRTHSIADDLRDYLQQLKCFKTSTTIRQFMESIEQAQQSHSASLGLCTVKLRLVGGWLTKTMDDLEKLVNELFKDKRYVLTHLKIERGSVIVTFSAPISEADSLVAFARETSQDFMVGVGLCGLRVGRIWVLQNLDDSVLVFSFDDFLLSAVATNKLDLIKFLLSININPDAAGVGQQTGLMIASFFNLDKAAGLLIKANADPDLQRDDGMTPLNIASQEGHSQITKTLLKASANPDIQRDDGVTPLYIASQLGHTDIVTQLLAAHASLDLHTDNGETPLFIACERGHTDIATLLLEAHANPNFVTAARVTSLYIACQNGHAKIVTLLLKASANPDIQRTGGETPLYIAIQKGYFSIITLLMETKANPNLQVDDAYGTTPLILATVNNQVQVVQLLLANGADPNLQHSGGLNALVFACHSGYLGIAELLLMSGADPNMKSRGLTAQEAAARGGHEDIVDLLEAIKLSQASTTSPALTANEIASKVFIDNETMSLLNKAKENMLVKDVESYISSQSKMLKKDLPIQQSTLRPIIGQ